MKLTERIKRVILAVVLIIPIYYIVKYCSPLPFLVLVEGVMVISLIEFYQIMENKGRRPFKIFGIISALLLSLSIYYNSINRIGLILTFITLLILAIPLIKRNFSPISLNGAITFLSIFYIGWLLSHLLYLRKLPQGNDYVILAIAVAWVSDGCAYFIGTHFGKHKLIPRISPKKTVEGGIAGLLGAIGTVFVVRWLTLPHLSLTHSFILGFLLGMGAQVGDLSESVFKREAEVKDSGNTLPGHGGFLDKIDSLLFTGPLLYYYIIWVIR